MASRAPPGAYFGRAYSCIHALHVTPVPDPPTVLLVPPESAAAPERAGVQVVGIGASAGGLEAFAQLIRALPPDTGLAFVLVQHLAPGHSSALAEILGRETGMRVVEVDGEPAIEPNHVYVIPPAQGLVLDDNVLHLVPRPHGVHHPIDQFFRSLAESLGHRAIGVVLSGTANDGSAGLEAIKAEGGVTFAQDDTARHDGMPHSAILTGIVDFVLPPDAIARELVRIARQPDPDEGDRARAGPAVARLMQLLRELTGVDFSQYKFNTLYRRIHRRMHLRRIADVPQYVQFVEETPAEARALYHDFLISVTSFFRDPPAFDALKATVFPALLRDRVAREPVRAWIAGCSTGQEAYSVAIAFSEYRESVASSVPLQLFATDVNGASIDTARAGLFPGGIVEEVSAERLRRYFVPVDGQFRISKEIRDCCVFSRHDLAADPPFSRVDLIGCRNLLIYLEPALQDRILPVLRHALKPAGFLWLGASETVGAQRALFDVVDARHRIYSPSPVSPAPAPSFVRPGIAPRGPTDPPGLPGSRPPELPREADRILAATFGPPSVLVTRELEILQVRGNTEPFLAPVSGQATPNLLTLLRESVLVDVRNALVRAMSTRSAVRAELRIDDRAGSRAVALQVIPVAARGTKEGGFLVVFQDAFPPRADPGRDPGTLSAGDLSEIGRLEAELVATRGYAQSVIEQHEVANEALQSANEEVQSANEELQSINEELETSKEEIQSTNEELATVNDELNHRNSELSRLNDDLTNLMASVQIPIIMIGRDLRIRRFTSSAERLLNLIPSDLGRPIGDIRLNLEPAPELEPLVAEVLETMNVREFDIQDRQGHWFSLRLRPYRTLENRIDGVVLMLVDIDAMVQARQYLESIVSTVREPLLVLDAELRVRFASAAFYRGFGVTPEETVGKPLLDLGEQQWNIPALQAQLLAVLQGQELRDFEVNHDFPLLGQRIMVLNARRMQHLPGVGAAVLLAIEDRTDERAWEERLAMSEGNARREHDQLRAIYAMAPLGMCLLDRELRYVIINDTMAAMNGLPAADHIGRTVREVVPDLAPSLEPAFRELLETGNPVIDVELRGETLAGPGVTKTWLESWYPLRDRAGAITGVNVIARDITAEVAIREELVRSTEQLRDADHRKDEFLAMLAHELRNPLAPIRNGLEVVKLALGHDPQALQASGMMGRQVEQMVRLVDDLLDVSRITRGTIELRKVPVELQQVVRQAIEAAHPMCAERGHALEAVLDPVPIVVNADPARLAQVVGNLVHNACKYTGRGGRIRVGVTREDGTAVITVTDNGIGLASDELSRVFDLFMQADTSLTRAESGLGIGLTLVRRLTEQHGGTASASSAGRGLGSAFTIRLPVAHDTLLEPAPPPAVEPQPPRTLRVLIVDDNRDSADSMSTLLRLHGHTTRVAYEGLEALEVAQEFRPDTILLDIGLPNLSGYEVARHIRSTPWGSSIRLVALTGWGQPEAREAARSVGFDAHLVKPVDLADLLQLLPGRSSG